MPLFDTPAPINVIAELGSGDVRVTASDRTDTVVEVEPINPTDKSDREAAEQSTVEFVGGTLRITSPRYKFYDPSRKTRAVRVTIELPSGSRLRADNQAGNISADGVLGETRVKTGAGSIRLDRTGPLHADTGAGPITVQAASGDTEATTSMGPVDIGRIDGTADLKTSSGDIRLGRVTGHARTRTAAGTITVEEADAGVEAKTGTGAIRIGSVTGGSLNVKTAAGPIDIGVAMGVAARLDVSTGFGNVRSGLDELPGAPGPTEKTVEIRAHSAFGDITIDRA